MLRFAIIGTGYRSEFYARAAKLSKDLVVAGWLARNEEKKIKLNEKYGSEKEKPIRERGREGSMPSDSP